MTKPKHDEFEQTIINAQQQKRVPEVVPGLGSLKKKDEPAPAYVPSWGNGPGFG